MMRTRALAAVLLTASLGLAACGGGDDDSVADLSATKILAKTNTAVADAEDITVKGEGASNGTTLKIELGFAEKDTTGTIDFNGAELTVLGVDGKTYLKSTPEVYQSFGTNGAKIAEAIGDKWIIIKADDANLGSFAQFGSKSAFFKDLLDPDSKLTKTKTKKIDGVETIGLKSSSGTLYVATDGGRPIQLVGGSGGQELNFDYDDVKIPAAPTSDETIDLNSLS